MVSWTEYKRRLRAAGIGRVLLWLLASIGAWCLINSFLLDHSHAMDIKLANYKLARYVRPTGKCAGAEQLATLYGNGDGLVGRRVSCGGVLDRGRATVAHRTLPCGSRVTLTNPHNGRSVVATVTDRGPGTSAKWDLGPAVTSALGLRSSTYVCVDGGTRLAIE